MTAEVMKRLFDYNGWANGLMLEALAEVPAGLYAADGRSSHGGLHGTMLHVVYAQHLWLLRWRGEPQEGAIERKNGTGTFDSLRAYWEEVARETSSFLGSRLSDVFLRETFTMKTTKGGSFVHSYGESMLHLIIHSGYHRGQVTALLRQGGRVPPNTDYIMYERRMQSAGGKG